MGRYRIVLEGEGSHGGGGANDADVTAKALAETLHAAGHQLWDAYFQTLGGRTEEIVKLLPPDKRAPRPAGG